MAEPPIAASKDGADGDPPRSRALSAIMAVSATDSGGLTMEGPVLEARQDAVSSCVNRRLGAVRRASIAAVSAAIGLTAMSAVGYTAKAATASRAGSNSSAWSVVPSPSSETPDGYLTDLSCTSASFCMAVGTDKGATNHRHDAALIEMWNGTVWSVQTSARPAGARITDLYGVSCTSATSCMAVGTYEPAGEISFSTGMTEEWNGATWSIVPTPDTGYSQLFSVSCSSTAACTAVGYDGAFGALAERWNGRTWTVQTTAAAGRQSQLDGVSCPSATDCVAVGSGLDLLVEVWNGSTWTAQPTPHVNFKFGLLTDVSCTSTTACMTVGYYYSLKGYKSGIAEQWNGSVWTIRPTLKHRGIDLSEVSCVSASACTAVGIHNNGINIKTLVEAWNGTAWVVQTSPDPSPFGNSLYGVSCTAAATCTAVGFTGAGVPLIESEGA